MGLTGFSKKIEITLNLHNKLYSTFLDFNLEILILNNFNFSLMFMSQNTIVYKIKKYNYPFS